MPIIPSQPVVLEQVTVEADSAEIGDYIEIKRKSKKLIFDLIFSKNGVVVKTDIVTLEDKPAYDVRKDEVLTVSGGKVTIAETPKTGEPIVMVLHNTATEVSFTANAKELTVAEADGTAIDVSYIYTVPANLAFSQALVTVNGQNAYNGVKTIAYNYAVASGKFLGTIS